MIAVPFPARFITGASGALRFDEARDTQTGYIEGGSTQKLCRQFFKNFKEFWAKDAELFQKALHLFFDRLKKNSNFTP